jgi:2-dehydropantoate 2-reductase
MRFAIFGVGAVGGYFGGRLAQAGEDVTFIARGDHLKVLRTKGLRVDSVKGDIFLSPVTAIDDPSKVGTVDVVLLGIKTWQVPAAAKLIQPLIGENTMVLPLQNGVEAASQLTEVLGSQNVCGGLAKIVCLLASPGHIRHTGMDPYIGFGELNNQPTARAETLLQTLKNAGINAEILPDIIAALWQKFLFVVSWGGIGAIARAPIGVIRTIPQTRRLLEQSLHEIADVARAHQIRLPGDIVSTTLDFMDTLPSNGTTSLQRDIAEGRPSEIEAWNGAVVRLGEEAEVAVSLNAFIYGSLLPLEKKARGELQFET